MTRRTYVKVFGAQRTWRSDALRRGAKREVGELAGGTRMYSRVEDACLSSDGSEISKQNIFPLTQDVRDEMDLPEKNHSEGLSREENDDAYEPEPEEASEDRSTSATPANSSSILSSILGNQASF